MNEDPLVFVSSTSDLQPERAALKAGIDPSFRLMLYEEVAANAASPMAYCRKMIGRADVFVCLLGANFGSPVPNDPAQRSIAFTAEIDWRVRFLDGFRVEMAGRKRHGRAAEFSHAFRPQRLHGVDVFIAQRGPLAELCAEIVELFFQPPNTHAKVHPPAG